MVEPQNSCKQNRKDIEKTTIYVLDMLIRLIRLCNTLLAFAACFCSFAFATADQS